MTQLNVYLTFNGNCREAMEFYHSCIGGELNMQTFGEAPGGEQMPEAERGLIMHSIISNGGCMLMASDGKPEYEK